MAKIGIKGMSCQHCVMAVTKALGSIPGVKDVHVDLEKGEAEFSETMPVDHQLIKARIEQVGFEVADR